ncbi:MAG: hypothetical protein BroJett011_17750 [Chloroflexota bacterium]|nr:MAG: hypothetical protein BroJett011_17750 [Chloroflexota bacterium]
MKGNPRFERAIKLLLIGSSQRYGMRTERLRQMVGDLADFQTYLEERGYSQIFTLVSDEQLTYAVISAADFPVSESLPISNGALALALYAWKFQAQHGLPVDHAHLVERFQFHKQASSRIKRYMTELERLGWLIHEEAEGQTTYSLTALGRHCMGLNFLQQVVKDSQGRDVSQAEVAEFFGLPAPEANQAIDEEEQPTSDFNESRGSAAKLAMFD